MLIVEKDVLISSKSAQDKWPLQGLVKESSPQKIQEMKVLSLNIQGMGTTSKIDPSED
jgi:hypothetical protein